VADDHVHLFGESAREKPSLPLWLRAWHGHRRLTAYHGLDGWYSPRIILRVPLITGITVKSSQLRPLFIDRGVFHRGRAWHILVNVRNSGARRKHRFFLVLFITDQDQPYLEITDSTDYNKSLSSFTW